MDNAYQTQTHGIVFVATGKSGLGHLRRVSTVARAIRARDGDVAMTLLTNAPPRGIAAGDLSVFTEILTADRRDMTARIARGGFGLAVLDTVVVPGIGALPVRKALILRETPDDRVEWFRLPGPAGWDRVIVPNPADHWMPPACLAPVVEAAGWILRPTGARADGEPSAGIVFATGGGGTAETRAVLYPILEALIAGLRRRAPAPVIVRQALGPRAGEAALAGADEVFDPGGALNEVFRAADVVVSTAGYNSVLELATTDTPALLVGIPRSIDDQMTRVRLWGPRLGHGFDPADPEGAADWLAAHALSPRRRPPVDPGPDGAARAADLLMELL